MTLSCKNCKSDCRHAGKRNPHMSKNHICKSHSEYKEDKPRSGYQPVDEDDPYDIMRNWWGNLQYGDWFDRADGAQLRVDGVTTEWIYFVSWLPGQDIGRAARMKPYEFRDAILLNEMVKR